MAGRGHLVSAMFGVSADRGERRTELAQGNRVVVTGRLRQRNFKTDAGDKRSVIELVADDVSVSLRHAMVRAVPSRDRTGEGEAGGVGTRKTEGAIS